MWLSAYVIPTIMPKSAHIWLLIDFSSQNRSQSLHSGDVLQCSLPYSHILSISLVSDRVFLIGSYHALTLFTVLALVAVGFGASKKLTLNSCTHSLCQYFSFLLRFPISVVLVLLPLVVLSLPYGRLSVR